MNASEVKGLNDLEVWLIDNVSPLSLQFWPDDWTKDLKHLINYTYMVGAAHITTEVKELSRVPEGWKLVLFCECTEALLEGMTIDPVTLTGIFKTDNAGRINGWEGQNIIR